MRRATTTRATALTGALLLAVGLGAAAAPLAGAAPAAPDPVAPDPAAPATPPAKGDVVPGSLLVTYAPGTSEGTKTAVEQAAGAADTGTVGAGTTVLAVDPAAAPAAIATLDAAPEVASVEPNYVVRSTAVPDDPSFGQLYALQNTGQPVGGQTGTPGADIAATRAWDTTTGSRSIVVAVTDSGIDYAHPDLAANTWSNPGGIGGCARGTHGVNVITGTCDPADDEGHGTHVSGTIGAVGGNGRGVSGVEQQASIMGLKFLDANGNGSTADAIKAIEFAVQAKIAGQDVRVINASWGGPDASTSLRAEIARATGYGILFVAAAGNGVNGVGQDADANPSYPAAYDLPGVVSVAATDNRDQLASFSDYGATSVDLGAPGRTVLSTLPGGAYGYLSGTSMATPQVAGAAALVLSAEPGLSVAQLKARLLGAVDRVPSLVGRTVTGGRLDVCRAITACAGSATTPTASSVALSTTGNAGVGVAGVGLTATVTPASATGTVTFTDGGAALPGCAAVPVAGGRAACVTTFATAGTHQVTARYSGDAAVAPSSATLAVDVAAAPSFLALLQGVFLRFAATFHVFGY
ncbi:hypothetical protein GCM10027047_32540 [Rhodococcus aerolatus]